MSKPLTFVLIISFFFGCFFARYNKLNEEMIVIQTIVVQSNDTLWVIAEKLDAHKDIRNTVQEIKKLNGLTDSTIYPGQELLVPKTSRQLVGMEINVNVSGGVEN